MNRHHFTKHLLALQRSYMEVSISGKRYTEQYKVEAVKQLTEHGHSIGDIAKRLDVTPKSLHDWRAQYGYQSGQWQRTRPATLQFAC